MSLILLALIASARVFSSASACTVSRLLFQRHGSHPPVRLSHASVRRMRRQCGSVCANKQDSRDKNAIFCFWMAIVAPKPYAKKIPHHCSTRPLKKIPNSIRQVISHCVCEKKSASIKDRDLTFNTSWAGDINILANVWVYGKCRIPSLFNNVWNWFQKKKKKKCRP